MSKTKTEDKVIEVQGPAGRITIKESQFISYERRGYKLIVEAEAAKTKPASKKKSGESK